MELTVSAANSFVKIITMGKIIVAGIGPGSPEDITPAVIDALRQADVVVGYQYYFQFISQYLQSSCVCVDTGMKKERERAEQAFEWAEQDKNVVVISSGLPAGHLCLSEGRCPVGRSHRTRSVCHLPQRLDDTMGEN